MIDEIIEQDCGCGADSLQPADTFCEVPGTIAFPRKEVLNFKAAVRISQAWNVPQCRDTVTVSSPDLSFVPVGAYLWSSLYGYFQIIKKVGAEIILLNSCTEGNASVGTTVPPNSTFIVSGPPVSAFDNELSFLESDLVTPPLGACTAVRLTSLEGISPGMQLQIGDVSYWATESLGGGLLRICENGGGGVPGNLIVAKNAFGQYQVPVVPASSAITLKKKVAGGPAEFSNASPNLYLIAAIPFRNPYINKAMSVKYKVTGEFKGIASTQDNTIPFQYTMRLFSQFDEQSNNKLVELTHDLYIKGGTFNAEAKEATWSGIVVIPARTDTVLYVAVQLAWITPQISRCAVASAAVAASAAAASAASTAATAAATATTAAAAAAAASAAAPGDAGLLAASVAATAAAEAAITAATAATEVADTAAAAANTAILAALAACKIDISEFSVTGTVMGVLV